VRLIDSHTHLDSHRFEEDREAVMERALAAGVAAMINVGADLASSQRSVALADRYPNVYASVGVHPHKARTVDGAALAELRALASHPKVVAVGEIGLDFYRDLSPRDQQRRAFRAQLAWAAKLGKPVIIHDREAHDEVLELLANWMAEAPERRRGVLHCFSGDLAMATEAVALGLYLGVDGPVTYRNARKLPEIVAWMPLDRLLIETDCPYLPPDPHRGQRNEPAYVRLVAAKVAEIKGLPLEEVARVTTENVRRLFGM
jgi:TatD DNase family protein